MAEIKPMIPMTEIKPAFDDKVGIGELFDEYTRMLTDLDETFGRYLVLQNYDEELEHLEEKYGPPGGRLYIALADGRPAGCIGLRRLDKRRCEMKRLYVRPEYRGGGLARKLVDQILSDAGTIGYEEIYLDTLPQLKEAVTLYRKYGFAETDPYNDSPVDGTIFMRRGLRRGVSDSGDLENLLIPFVE